MRSFGLLLAAIFSLNASMAEATATRPVPLISQRLPRGSNERWQGGMRCGPASMAMVARAHGVGDTLSDAKLVHRLDLLDGKLNSGTSRRGIHVMANALGLGVIYNAGYSHEVVARAHAQNDVVVALGSANPANHGGHYVVVAGQRADGSYVVHDPGGEHGVQRFVSPDALRRFVENHPAGNGGLFVMK